MEYQRYKNLENRFKIISDFKKNRALRTTSILKQAEVILSLNDCNSVLEIGCLRGVLSAILRHFKIDVETIDIEENPFINEPTYLGDFEEINIQEIKKRYDLVCAFQVLEHNSFEKFPYFLNKLKSLSKKYIYISLPYEGAYMSFEILTTIPYLRRIFSLIFQILKFHFPRPIFLRKNFKQSKKPSYFHQFEIGGKISIKEIESVANNMGLKTIISEHNKYFPRHYFFLFQIEEKS